MSAPASSRSRLSNPVVLVPELGEIGPALGKATANGSIPQSTISLAHLRAGQIVGSTYLTVLHSGNLRNSGESEERITAVASWRDAPYFTEPERVALALVEAVFAADGEIVRVPDELYVETTRHYDEKAIATLAVAIGQVAFWAAIALIGRPLPGVSPAEQWRQ
jgi:alkylhydroperoxidase family enzyme